METEYFYIMGAASGVGKTMICEGLLSQLLENGFCPEQLAYIKPMTQCTEKQPVTLYCEKNHITHPNKSSLVFEKGFTKDFINQVPTHSWPLLAERLADIFQISENKQIVLVDGIGGVSTGSVIGVSNVDIALALDASVLFVGSAGIGSAIDDTVLAISFMQQQGIKDIALVYNKIRVLELNTIKYFVKKRLAELIPDVPVLDFIVEHRQLNQQAKHLSVEKISQWFRKGIK